jgi:hypothetical protein
MILARGIFLALLLSITSASADDTFQISPNVFASYQEYLKTIGSTKKGAFAVADDGYGSYYFYCPDISCVETSNSQIALTRCQSINGKKCRILAYGREERLKFTVIAKRTELKSNDEILAHVLPADRLKAYIVGNTMQGEYPNHRKWEEYYAQDGTLRGKADALGSFRGSYEFKDNTVCYHYQGHSDWDWCGAISVSGDAIRFLEAGKLVSDEFNTRWLQGNPVEL